MTLDEAKEILIALSGRRRDKYGVPPPTDHPRTRDAVRLVLAEVKRLEDDLRDITGIARGAMDAIHGRVTSLAEIDATLPKGRIQ